MGRWIITNPTTGKNLTVEGDQAPTQQDAAEIFEQHGAQQPAPQASQPQSLDQGFSVGGLAGNAAQNVGKILSGIAGIPKAMTNLQQQYGTPNELLMKDPLQYAGIMTAPIRSQINQFASYTPLQDVAAGKPTEYFGRVANKVYKEPVTAALDALSAAQLINALKPNPTALAEGEMLKQGVFPSQVKAAYQASLPKPVERMPLNQSIGKNTYAGIWNVPKYKGTYGLDPTRTGEELIRDYGITNPKSLDNLIDISNQVTGTNGVVNNIKMDTINAVGNAPIDTTSVVRSMTNKLMEIPGMDAQKAFGIADTYIKNLAPTAIPGQFNLSDAFGVQQKLSDKSRQYAGAAKQTGNPDIQDYADAMRFGRDELKMQIDEAIANVDKTSNTQALLEQFKTPERLAQMDAISPKLGDAVRNAKSVADLQNIERTFVNASQLSQESLKQMTRPLSTIGQNVGYGAAGGAMGFGLAGFPGLVVGSVLGPIMRPLLNTAAEAIRTPFATGVGSALYNLPLTGVSNAISGGISGLGTVAQQSPNIANLLRMIGQGVNSPLLPTPPASSSYSQNFPSPEGTAYAP